MGCKVSPKSPVTAITLPGSKRLVHPLLTSILNENPAFWTKMLLSIGQQTGDRIPVTFSLFV